MRAVHSLAEIDALIEEGHKLGDEPKRIDMLCNVYYDPKFSVELDPFSDEYLQRMLDLYAALSGKGGYSPATHELLAGRERIDVAQLARQPSPYVSGVEITGDFLIALGFLMKLIAPRPGAAIIEYGAGGGQLALFLARVGYDVTVVDIEPIFIEAIKLQAASIGVPITALVGEFGQTPDPQKRYDAVIFFEAFHHALRHNELLRRLHDVVADGGVIALTGEPILPLGSYWEPTVPYPWGLRCDALSLFQLRGPGWMELGFRESYLLEAVARAGWRAELHTCSLTPRGTTYLLRRADPGEAASQSDAADGGALAAAIEPAAPAPPEVAANPVGEQPSSGLLNRLRRRLGLK